MTLDVLIPTYNRAELLQRTLESLLATELPASMTFTVTVCDNNSADDTPHIVAAAQQRFDGRLQYMFEPAPGRSAALNTAIASTRGDLVAMIDDDEEVDRNWLRCIERAFQDSATDFIGGPYVPSWTIPIPEWLPSGYGSVIGQVDSGPDVRQYGPGFDGMLMGGNAVVRRRLLQQVGPYRTDLGRTASRLMSCEDEEMFNRLLGFGARGYYRPDLIVYHHVMPERATKRYFRRWCFWHGVSLGTLDRHEPQRVAYVFGIPRYIVGRAVRAAVSNAINWRLSAAEHFKHELAWWDLFGFVYGRHWLTRRQPRSRGDAVPAPGAGTYVCL